MPDRLLVAYTLEQCWHDVPGGSAVAALELARRLAARDDVELIGVAGRHRRPPEPAFAPPVPVSSLPVGRPLLYETWNRFGWPIVESVTGVVDVCHSTVAIPAATRAPHVVTVHDVAFVHAPERFTRHGVRVMRAGLERCRAADLILCPSAATRADLGGLGFDVERVRVVPWGVTPVEIGPGEVERVRLAYGLPERFVLFVGTVEPRKNLARLGAAVAALDDRLPLVVASGGAWSLDGELFEGDVDVRQLGFVPGADLQAVYAAATVFAYPSLQEGFGLPIAEAMSQGTPVVTSSGSATEEVAGGAAVLVDPLDVGSIRDGLVEALASPGVWAARGRARAASLSWDTTVERTVAAYREVAG